MFYIIILALLELILFIKNFIPGTYLIGWDNLMPEFNIWLNLKRSLFSVWQEYRGLGLYDGMSHASNLMHTIYILLLSFVFPTSMIRYVFIFLTHLAGGIGFFLLAKRVIKNEKASFIGALLYLFNLGVVQIYTAPLEVFVVHFAALPFLILLTINALEKPSKKNYMLLFLCSIVMTPQGFVPTVFGAFFILFLFVLFFSIVFKRNSKSIIIVFFIVLTANLFWLLPFVYGAKSNAKIIENTRINQFSSEEIYYRNKAFGDILNVLSLKGFMMDGMELDTKTNTNVYLMDIWRKHSTTILYKILFVAVTTVFFYGFYKTIKEKKKDLYPFLAALLLAFFFLANNTPVLEQLNNLIRLLVPVIGEAFRFPFTKFMILFTFCYSVIFAYGLSYLLNNFKKFKTIIFIFSFLIVIYISFPAFQGYFISPFMKQQIPNSYFQAINYFENVNENQRIAFLPTPSFWNWENRNWGQRGSGFLWYGLPQAIMLRAFDPWSNYNEQFYNEIAYAQKKESPDLFNKVLQKYNIDYLLLDKSIINDLSPKPINYDQMETFLRKDNELTRETVFGQLKIYKVNNPSHNQFIYLLNNPNNISPKISYYYEDPSFGKYGNYIVDQTNPQEINLFPSLFTEKTQDDLEFKAIEEKDAIVFKPKNNPFSSIIKQQDYTLNIPSISSSYLIPAKIGMNGTTPTITILQPIVTIDNSIYTPAPIAISLSLRVVTNPATFKLTESNQSFKLGDTFYLVKDFPNTLKVTDIKGNSELTQVRLNQLEIKPSQINIKVGLNSNVSVQIPKIQSSLSYNQLIENKEYTILGDKSNITENGGINIKTNGKKVDLVVYKDNLPHQNGYIIFANASWETGLPLDFYVDNPFDKRSELEAKTAKTENFTNVFFLPPTQNVYSGYGFHFVADPVGKQPMQTTLKHIEIYPVPYEVLKGITLTQDNINTNRNETIIDDIKISKNAPYLYLINLNNVNQSRNNYVLALSQAFNIDWKAYQVDSNNFLNTYFPFLFGKEIKDHLLVNNWANGWKFGDGSMKQSNNATIIIIFWPQYLEFIGFALLIIAFLFIIIKYGKTVISSNKKS